jgi:hypothetical protein
MTAKMRLLAAAFTLVASTAILHIQTQSPPDDSVRAAIDEHFTKVSGVTLDFPADWSVDHYEVDGSDCLLHLRSGSDRMVLVDTPLDPDEKLHEAFKYSLMGFLGGGRFIAVGEQRAITADGREVLVQQFKSKKDDQVGAFGGFFSHNSYVQIMHVGPKQTVQAREAILKSLRIRP